MVGKTQKKVEMHLKPKELNKCINKKEKEADVLRKLYVIRDFYKGKKAEDISKNRRITLPTVHRWLDRWNDEGYEGLYPKYHNVGRPSKLSLEDKKRLNDILEKENYLNPKKVSKIIKDEFHVEYCASQQSILLKSLGFHYTKHYQIYSKRPDDAEDLLEKNFHQLI